MTRVSMPNYLPHVLCIIGNHSSVRAKLELYPKEDRAGSAHGQHYGAPGSGVHMTVESSLSGGAQNWSERGYSIVPFLWRGNWKVCQSRIRSLYAPAESTLPPPFHPPSPKVTFLTGGGGIRSKILGPRTRERSSRLRSRI